MVRSMNESTRQVCNKSPVNSNCYKIERMIAAVRIASREVFIADLMLAKRRILFAIN